MKKLSFVLISAFSLLTFMGCDLVSSSSSSPNLMPEEEHGGFLWKPRSESTGNLVVLLPHSTYRRTEGTATISGDFGTESAPMRGEDDNGNRPHFYFSRPGAAYGGNITVQAPLTDGTIFSTVVPHGSRRTTK